MIMCFFLFYYLNAATITNDKLEHFVGLDDKSNTSHLKTTKNINTSSFDSSLENNLFESKRVLQTKRKYIYFPEKFNFSMQFILKVL